MWGKSSYHRNYVIVAENIRQVQLHEEQSKAFSIITIDLHYDPAIPLMGISLKPYFPLKKKKAKIMSSQWFPWQIAIGFLIFFHGVLFPLKAK